MAVTRTDAVKPETPSQMIHEFIKRDRLNVTNPREGVADYRNFADGETGIELTDEMEEVLKGLLGYKACENLGHKIVAEARDRLTFEEWECADEAVKKFLDKLFTREKIQERQAQVHYDTLLDADHGLAVNWDNAKKRVRIYREPWWDGCEGLFIAYDSHDDPVYAVKDWNVQFYDETGAVTGQGIRRVVYFDDRFERWVSTDAGMTWEPFPLPEDNGVWPIPWLTMQGEPLGIPYVHFRNTGRGQGVYGKSELHGGVLGLIVQVQDLHYAMSGGARFNGFPVITAAGVTLEKDAEGKDIPLEAYPGGILHTDNPQGKFGSIEAGDPSGLVTTRREKLHAISTTTQTPFHVIEGGEWPSGEALLRAEQPAVGKANSQVGSLKNCWSGVGHLAVKIQNRFGTEPELNEDIETALITARFASTERRDPLSKSVIVNNVKDVVSEQEARRLFGYTEKQAEDIGKEMEEERSSKAESDAIMFSRGIGTGLNRGGGAVQAQEDETKGTGAQTNTNQKRK